MFSPRWQVALSCLTLCKKSSKSGGEPGSTYPA